MCHWNNYHNYCLYYQPLFKKNLIVANVMLLSESKYCVFGVFEGNEVPKHVAAFVDIDTLRFLVNRVYSVYGPVVFVH